MSALEEFANFITFNMANLATTYARLLAERGQGYETWPVNSCTAFGRKLLKAVVEAFKLETSTPFIDILVKHSLDAKPVDSGPDAPSARWSGNITPPDPLLEVECLGQTLTPVVTNLEAGKFLWQILSETRVAVLRHGTDATGVSWDVTERKEMEDRLGKRVRELHCLNEIGREMEEAPPLAELLQWVTERIPAAMQHPNLCQTAIEFDGNVYGPAKAIDLPAQITHGLYIKGQMQGRVYIAYTDKHDFLDEESAILGAVASRLSSYIENRRLLEETEAALAEAETLIREQNVLNELGQALTTRLKVDEVLEETYRQTSRLIDTTNFYIGLYDSEKEEISFRFDVSESEIDRTITIMPASQGIAGYIIRKRTSLLFQDNVSARQEALGITMVGEEPKSWLGVPLIVGDRAVGVMAVQNFTTPGLYGEHERETLTAIANQTAIAIQNARQFEVAQRQARREQTIREITDKMRGAISLEQLIKTATTELGERLSAGHALVELGLMGTVTEDQQPNGAGGDGPAIGEEQ